MPLDMKYFVYSPSTVEKFCSFYVIIILLSHKILSINEVNVEHVYRISTTKNLDEMNVYHRSNDSFRVDRKCKKSRFDFLLKGYLYLLLERSAFFFYVD